MRSSNLLVIGPATAPGRGGAELVDVAAEPPIVVRRAGGRILFGAAAAGPLGGDRIEVDVRVEPGAVADVGTVGATMVLPGASPATSFTATTIALGAGSHVDWCPEPLISVTGSDHEAELIVRLDATATMCLTEEFALGRTGEESGTLRTRVRIERGGRPLLDHAEALGPGQRGVGSLAAGPTTGHTITRVVVGPAARAAITRVAPDRWAGVFPLAVDAVVVLAVAPDRPAATDLLDEVSPPSMV